MKIGETGASSIKVTMLNSEFASVEETILEADEVEDKKDGDEVVDDLDEDEKDDDEEDDEEEEEEVSTS